jgi:chorismate mutase
MGLGVGERALRALREEMARVTLEIVRLCGRRLMLAGRIGEVKAGLGLPLENRRVEEGLRRMIIEECRLLGLSEEFGTDLLDLLIEESKKVQRKILEKGRG